MRTATPHPLAPHPEIAMKNPWMSAWLSNANRMTNTARSQSMAEMQRMQKRMMLDWQKAWMDAYVGAWFPGAKPPGKKKE